MTQDYKPNSHRFKEQQKEVATTEKKKVEKVVSGTAVKKRNDMRKLTDIFISEDAENVKSYIFMDVLVPAIKKAISDIVTDGIDMVLYGSTGRSRKSSGADRVSYRSYYDDKKNDRYRSSSARYSYDDIRIPTRAEAETVLDRLDEIIEMYDQASVADYYDLCGVTGQYTDQKYGWTNLRNAKIERVRDGYVIKLPPAKPLD